MGDSTHRVSGLPAVGPGSVASVGDRATAGLLDVFLFVVVWYVAADWRPLVPVVLVDVVVLPWLFGVTAGKLAVQLRVRAVDEGRVVTGQRGLTLPTAFARALPTVVGFPFWLLVWGLTVDRDRRNWPDRVTRTVVVTTR